MQIFVRGQLAILDWILLLQLTFNALSQSSIESLRFKF